MFVSLTFLPIILLVEKQITSGTISPLLYFLENHLKNLNIPISIIYFVDNNLFISQNKSLVVFNFHLFCSYNVMSKLLKKFGLIVEYSKTEVFHFNRLQGFFNPPFLDLLLIRGPIIKPRSTWKYLGFIFDKKLTFH